MKLHIVTTFLWGPNQHHFVIYVYCVCTENHVLPLKQTWTSAHEHSFHYSSFSCLHFLRQKQRISVAEVGGLGPARMGIVFFSILP